MDSFLCVNLCVCAFIGALAMAHLGVAGAAPVSRALSLVAPPLVRHHNAIYNHATMLQRRRSTPLEGSW